MSQNWGRKNKPDRCSSLSITLFCCPVIKLSKKLLKAMKTKNYAKHYRQEPNGKVFPLHLPSIPHGIYGGGCLFTSGCHQMSFWICDGML
jgi:hypothetical protein